MNNSSPSQAVPQEIRGWNWGAFGFCCLGLGWLWAWRHGLKKLAALLFLVFLFHVGLFVIMQGKGFSKPVAFSLNISYIWLGSYLGRNGSVLAWRSRHFETAADFIAYRRVWGWWAFSITTFMLGFTLGVFSFFIWLDSH